MHNFYREEPVFARRVGYTRVMRQKLSFMRAYINDKRPYTARLRRAYAEAAILKEMAPIIHDDELIVGLPDFSPLTEEEQREYDELSIAMRGVHDTTLLTLGHMALDYPKLLRLGVNGLIDEIKEKMTSLDLNEPSHLQKYEFYEGCLIELDALLVLQKKYAAHALALSKNSTGQRKAELEKLHEVLLRVPAEPARTFYEALECIHFFNFNLWELYYFGRVDQYLYPFYRADLEAKRITYDEAVELFACFLLMPEAYILPNASLDSFVGGRDADGNSVENEVTHIALDAVEYARSGNGKIAMAIHRGTSEELLRKAIRLNGMGICQPALFNDDLVTEGLIKAGIAPQDARLYANTGCVEMTPIGKSGIYPVAPYHNLAKYFLDAMRVEPFAKSLDELTERFSEIVRHHVFQENLNINRRQMERSRNGGEPLRVSCLVDDCIARGMAIDEGGARYNQIQPNFIGFANVVDSICSVDHLIFQEKRLTMAQFLEILDADYAGEEALRQYIVKRLPHYGQDDDYTNGLAIRLSEILVKACEGITTYRGSRLVPGTFSYTENWTHGRATQATPDGRHAQLPLSASSGASAGMETNGPTAALNSVTSWDHRPFMGGVVINIKFSPGEMSGKGEENMLQFLHAFLERGGMEMQFNCVDRATLLDAQKHPEAHRDLLVRVSGFSAHFTKLPAAIQQEIIDRNEHSF